MFFIYVTAILLQFFVTDTLSQNCPTDLDARIDCAVNDGLSVNEEICRARGCCWQPSQVGSNVPWCFKQVPTIQSCPTKTDHRVDCAPGNPQISEETCRNQGCCWQPYNGGNNIPFCFKTITQDPGCSFDYRNRIDCAPEEGISITENICRAKGCCWQPSYDIRGNYPWCFISANTPQCSGSTPSNQRFDCIPEGGGNPDLCAQRGCCWQPYFGSDQNVPWCIHSSSNYASYKVDSKQTTSNGFVLYLSRQGINLWPNPIEKLTAFITFETESRLRIKLVDTNAQRWEVPIELDKPHPNINVHNFNLTIREQPFGIKVARKSDGLVLFDTISLNSPLLYSDQFLEITTVSAVSKIYGIGEEHGSFMKDLNNGYRKVGLWSRDVAPWQGINLYGVHNFHLGLSDAGSAYGVFFLNSNAQEVVLQTIPSITYRSIGGILDFFIFSGPTPENVIQQYWNLVGSPILPPFWSLGFHLTRWGYPTLQAMHEVTQRNLNAKIPFDAHWVDIEYMEDFKDWTVDKNAFGGLSEYVKYLHNMSMRFVPIVDPAIPPNSPGVYPTYDKGKQLGIYINKTDNSGELVGEVWPGRTVFPDFSNPASFDWWYQSAKEFHDDIPFDGLWIDMNEPANFVVGSTEGCPSNNLENPPYMPDILGKSLKEKTLCASSRQYLSTHYDMHSLYGHFEAAATNYALRKIKPNKRPFILSRSTFAGSGKYTFHWTGDVFADWPNMHNSIQQILNFNLFGIPMVGTDVCGFLRNSNEELCIRWMQLGSFYPFMRNHNDKWAVPQDPAIFNEYAQDIMRNTLIRRYRLLPYLYTTFYHSSVNHTTVFKPLFFEYPNDSQTFGIDKQFMLGKSLMIIPALEQGQTTVWGYIPNDKFYNFDFGFPMQVSKNQWTTFYTPLDQINVFIRGGSVLPLIDQPAVTTDESRTRPFMLAIALNDAGEASGDLFWDDGESEDYMNGKRFNYIEFNVSNNRLTSTIKVKDFTEGTMNVDTIRISGVANQPKAVEINGLQIYFSYDSGQQTVYITNLTTIGLSLLENFEMIWTF